MHLFHSCRIAALLAVAATAAGAQGPLAPPPWPASHDNPPPLAADPAHPLLLGPVRVLLDTTTLADVQRAIGAGEPVRHGRGAEALDWLCFTLADAEPAQRVWLTSSELVGFSKVDGVTAVELPPGERPVAGCPALPARFRPVRFEGGLWLGPLDGEQRKAMAIPAQGSASWGGLYHGNLAGLDTVGTIAVEVRKARAVAIHLARN